VVPCASRSVQNFKRHSILIVDDKIVNGGWELRITITKSSDNGDFAAISPFLSPINFSEAQQSAAAKMFEARQTLDFRRLPKDFVDMRGVDLVAIDSGKTAFRDDGLSVIRDAKNDNDIQVSER